MGNNTEQTSFDLGDKGKPNVRRDPDTRDGVLDTIAGGKSNRWRGRVMGDELLQRPDFTHTIGKGMRVYCLGSNVGEVPVVEITSGEFRLSATGQTIAVADMAGKPEYVAIDGISTHLKDSSEPIDHVAGTTVLTLYAVKVDSKIAQSHPSAK